MALTNTSDPVVVGKRLTSWLPDAIADGQPVTVSDVVVPQASGMSSETILFQATWTDSDGTTQERGLVLRIPTQNGIFPDTDIAREAAVMRAVRAHSTVPVPEILVHEQTGNVLGTPFLVMERLYGEVPADDPPYVLEGFVHDMTDAQRSVLYDNALRAIASVQIDPVEAGLVEVLGHPELGETPLAQEIAHWKNNYEWSKRAGRPHPTIDAALEILENDIPEGGRLSLSWGDSRFGNLMFGPDQQVTGAFDWEMAALGRPELDLGLFLFAERMYAEGMGLPSLGGFPGRDAAIARYAELLGESLVDVSWFEAFSGVRCCIAIMRIGNMLIDMGAMPEDASMPYANPAATTLAQILDLPAPTGDSRNAEIFASRVKS